VLQICIRQWLMYSIIVAYVTLIALSFATLVFLEAMSHILLCRHITV